MKLIGVTGGVGAGKSQVLGYIRDTYKARILLADEPTGALDSKAATNLLKQLREINQTGQTILMVTHSNVAASYADRVMFIKDGEVFHQIYRGDMTRSALLDKICDAVTVLMRGGEDSES